jgi:shikimate dehydrogenase
VRAAVLGQPIAHSLSPVLHRAAYASLELTDWSYDAIECSADGLPALLAQAREDPQFGGYSLTMPLKVAALALVDDLQPLASRVAAVNTVVARGWGLYGANTDVPGMVAALREAGIESANDPLVLGGGGSAQAAVAALADLGAAGVKVAIRNPARAQPLAEVAERAGIALTIVGWEPEAIRGSDLLISTVPANAADDWTAGWDPATSLFDLVYAPWPTTLAQAATRAGARVVGGLDLLVHQAVGQVALMTGCHVDISVLRAAGEKGLAAR